MDSNNLTYNESSSFRDQSFSVINYYTKTIILANFILKGWFLPIGITLAVVNNIHVIVILFKSRLSYVLSKTVRIFYLAIALADILDCLFIHLIYFTGKIFLLKLFAKTNTCCMCLRLIFQRKLRLQVKFSYLRKLSGKYSKIR